MAPLFSTGSHTRSLSRFCSRPTWPLASTTTLRPHARARRRPRRCTRDADRALALEEHLQHAHALVHLDAVLARVVEHHLVELAAHDLPGLRALVRLVVPEVERRRQLAARVDELHAVLLDEVALLHLVQHAEPLEHPVGLGDQRLADVEAREALALEERDALRPCWARRVETVEPAGPPPMTTTSGVGDSSPPVPRARDGSARRSRPEWGWSSWARSAACSRR